jgi:ADP-heptose:LPS heptosyltransferase
MVYGHVADVLSAGPSLKALRETYPEATISVLAVPYVREMLEACPYVDRVIVMTDLNHKGSRWVHAERLLKLATMTPRLFGRFDMVLVLHARSNFLARLAFLTGAPIRAGYQDENPAWLYTHRAQPYQDVVSFRAENRRVLEAVGIPVSRASMEIWTSPRDDAAVDALLQDEGTGADDVLIGLHPGSHWTCQQWYPHQWAALGDMLADRYGARLVITGTADEISLAREIADGMRTRPLVLAGRTTIPEFAALIRRLRLLICVNSAASQLALATGTPMLNLIGYENPTWTAAAQGELMTVVRGFKPEEGKASWCPWHYWGRLSECHKEGACLGRGGMQTITPDLVLAAAERYLVADVTVNAVGGA